MGRNIGEALANLEMCLKLLGAVNRVKEFVQVHNFYAALRCLDELQDVQIKELAHHEFTKMIKESIPGNKKLIQEAVMARLKAWLFE